MGCAGLNRRWDAPAEIGDGGTTMGCAGLNRRWDAPAEIGDGGTAIGCTGRNVISGAATPAKYDRAARRWDAPAKNLIGRRDDALAEIDMAAQRWDALAEMRIAARQWDAPADQRDGGAAMGCAGRSKIVRRGEEMRRPK